MSKRIIMLLIAIVPLVVCGQLFDDFSDGDFSSNPAWVGDVDHFAVNDNYQLQLNWEGQDVSYLSTSFQMSGETEWRFWIRLNFSPSDNNLARVYLASDVQNVKGPVNGYFLRFGENLANDAIELYRQNGDETTLICRGTDGLIANAFQLWVRVRRNMAGNWSIEVDNTGFGAYATDATGFDDQITTSQFFGLHCRYTASNSKNFFFDDIYAGPLVVDISPPELAKIEATSSNSLELYFDEALKPEPAGNPQNFLVSNGIDFPRTASLDQQNPGKILLSFDRNFPSGLMLQITIQNMTDLSGNIANPIDADFLWFRPEAFDVQINEIMADPAPPVGLPDEEYIELFNTTDKLINLNGWKLVIGNTVREFGEVYIQPEGYLLLGHINSADPLSQYGSFYGFTGFILTNAGQTVVLKNAAGQVISAVSYSDTWYGDANKRNGGWSLEQIDPENPCGGRTNWTASMHSSGGTPGAPNSVKADNPDLTPPFLQRVEIVSPNQIIVHFSEPMDSALLASPQTYLIDQSVGMPQTALPTAPHYRSALLTLDQASSLADDVVYTLSIEAELSDCAGNLIDRSVTARFGLPKPVMQNDVVINEVLFNPKDDFARGVEFVEVYNRSDKIIDLSAMILANEDRNTGEISSPRDISQEGLLLFPAEYMVLTRDPDVVKLQYYIENPGAFIQMASFPQYANSEGVVILATKGFEIIDRFAYNEKMHIPLLRSFKGVSLERIHYDRLTHDATNWHSAAEDAGFATPGYKNSQFSHAPIIDDPITIHPEIFSPDMDGIDDVLNISYQFDRPGFVANINIYDSRGRPVRQLVNNELLGTEGVFSWDGFTDSNLKAPLGIYIILFEVFDASGARKTYKKTAVLGGRLN